MTWSIWQRSAGASQKGWVQRWSLISMARRVAPVKKRAVSGALDPGPGRKDDAFEVRPLQPGQQRTGADDGSPLDPADAPMEGLITHQDAEEGRRTPVRRVGPLGAHRHLDQGVGSTLRRGVGQLTHLGVTPEGLFGRRPLGLEEVLFDPGELARHDGPRDRVEVPAQEVHPVDGLDHVGVTPGPTGQVGFFGPSGSALWVK